MADISTNNPVDPNVLVALKAIRESSANTQGSTQQLREPLEELLKAIKEITKR